MAAHWRVLGKERTAPGSGTMWRAAVPAKQRAVIGELIESAKERPRYPGWGASADAAMVLDTGGLALVRR